VGLAHFTVGEGDRKVLLLHGFLGSGRNLTTVAKRLAEADAGLRVIVPDLRGHGASPALPAGADLGTLAADVLELADGRASYVGHSLGGRVALQAALAAPDTISDIALLDITPSPITRRDGDSTRALAALLTAPDHPTRDQARAHLVGAGLSEGLVDWLLMNLVRDGAAWRWRIDRAALDALHPRVNAADLWRAVEGPRPYGVRCVRGGGSPYVPDDDAARLDRAGCRVVTIPRAGHFVHVDALEAVLDALGSPR
jgi:pimeloyl-ACP methyl ester carboxylesterase